MSENEHASKATDTLPDLNVTSKLLQIDSNISAAVLSEKKRFGLFRFAELAHLVKKLFRGNNSDLNEAIATDDVESNLENGNEINLPDRRSSVSVTENG